MLSSHDRYMQMDIYVYISIVIQVNDLTKLLTGAD